MKRFLLIALTCIAIGACSKEKETEPTPEGTVFVRVQGVDKDGVETYSPVVTVYPVK